MFWLISESIFYSVSLYVQMFVLNTFIQWLRVQLFYWKYQVFFVYALLSTRIKHYAHETFMVAIH